MSFFPKTIEEEQRLQMQTELRELRTLVQELTAENVVLKVKIEYLEKENKDLVNNMDWWA